LQQREALNVDLERFLDAGPPPVYIGFGHMPGHNSKETVQLFLNTASQNRHRFTLNKKWSRLGISELYQNCFFVGNVSHSLLFPRLAAVVHHGGAGTTATAARAGVLQIIIPHFWDQFYWAMQVFSKGIGPKPIKRSRLSPKNLKLAMLECTQNDYIKCKVHEVSKVLCAQDSLSETIAYIEQKFI
jgi:sterol 3beta-glucosyltransferase